MALLKAIVTEVLTTTAVAPLEGAVDRTVGLVVSGLSAACLPMQDMVIRAVWNKMSSSFKECLFIALPFLFRIAVTRNESNKQILCPAFAICAEKTEANNNVDLQCKQYFG